MTAPSPSTPSGTAVQDVVDAVHAARMAAYGDSNDDEIELLAAALDLALDAAGIDVPPLTPEQVAAAEN